MLSPAFSERTLKDQEQILHTYIDLFIKRLHEVSEEGKKPMEMTVWWNVCDSRPSDEDYLS